MKSILALLAAAAFATVGATGCCSASKSLSSKNCPMMAKHCCKTTPCCCAAKPATCPKKKAPAQQ